VTTFKTATKPVREVAADLLIVPVFTGEDVGPGMKETGLADAYAAARLTGKKGETLLVTRRRGDKFAAEAVLLVGVGPKEGFDLTTMRRTLAKALAGAHRFPTVATTFALAFPARQAADAVQTAVEAIGLGAYRFDRYKKPGNDPKLTRATVLVSSRWDAKAISRAARAGEIVADAVCWARDLVNTPAGDLPPAAIAKEAQAMAKTVGLTCKVWTEAQLKQGGFGGILGVGQGSVNPPRMIELRYTGAGKATPIALSGKGIAFDSGGLSIKDAAGMETMKCDMGAQKPGDVIKHRGGTTSEVLNTDAEGRLILADALAYLVEQDPSCIVDTATLTGACMVALGTDITGAFGNDDVLAQDLVAAGSAVGEPIWQMPLWEDYRPLIDSKVADIKNVGKRYGGAITAAWFLAEFVGDTPWVHLDIAGPAFADAATDLGPAGGTGVPVRALVRFVLDRAEAR
jgi:leucyl aminopeptidase